MISYSFRPQAHIRAKVPKKKKGPGAEAPGASCVVMTFCLRNLRSRLTNQRLANDDVDLGDVVSFGVVDVDAAKVEVVLGEGIKAIGVHRAEGAGQH